MQTILLKLDTIINNYASVDLMQGYNYTLEAHITDNYKDMDLTGVTVQLQMQKPDKKFIIQTENIIIEGNKIKATLDKDFTREDGQAKLQVVLLKDNFTFGSWVVKAKIKPSAINNNDGQSENKVTITEALVNKINEAENTKIELDESIANGDVATIKGNVDKIKDVEIPKINEQLDSIENKTNLLEISKATKIEVVTLSENKMDKNTTEISISQINKNKGKLDQTYMTDEFLQQIIGTTPINTTPSNDSITYEKLFSKVADRLKSKFIIPSIFKWDNDYLYCEVVGNEQMGYGYTTNKGSVFRDIVSQRILLDGDRNLIYLDVAENPMQLHKLNDFTTATVDFLQDDTKIPIAIKFANRKICFYEKQEEKCDYIINEGGFYIENNLVKVSSNCFIIGSEAINESGTFIKVAENSQGYDVPSFGVLVLNLSTMQIEIKTWNGSTDKFNYNISKKSKYIVVAYRDIFGVLHLKQNKDFTQDIVQLKEGISNIQTTQSYWKGKKIVWFGTSIPAGDWTNADRQYPNMIAKNLGANMFNESVGSSPIRMGNPNNVSANDTYGWTGLPWENVCFSLSQNLAQKNELINNWSKWKTLLVNNPPNDISVWADKIRDCSYENKLIARHIGDGKRADLYVFDHGHNDLYTDETDLTKIPTNTKDRMYFIGATNFLIDIILKDNPRAKILFIGHYENDRKQAISKAQEVVSNYWSFPLIKTWEKMGWSQKTVETTGYWDNGNWVNSGGSLRNLPLTKIWMADDLHPSSDLENRALQKYTDVLTPIINNVR